jgi:hypothetical protein
MRSGGGGDRPKLSHHLPTGVRPTAIPEREENFYTGSSLQALLMGLSHIFGERVKRVRETTSSSSILHSPCQCVIFLNLFHSHISERAGMPCWLISLYKVIKELYYILKYIFQNILRPFRFILYVFPLERFLLVIIRRTERWSTACFSDLKNSFTKIIMERHDTIKLEIWSRIQKGIPLVTWTVKTGTILVV